MNLARILALAAVAAAGTAPAQTWVIADGEHGSQVTFTSKAPMETFQGRTHDVTGTVAIARGDADTLRVAAVVAMATLDTGIALRNRHMRENHLETDRFPEGRFEGEGTLAPAADGARTVTLHGTLTLHGVAREVDVPASLAADEAGVQVTAEFPVALADHEIERPGFLVMKLGEVQQVQVRLLARAAEPEAAPEP